MLITRPSIFVIEVPSQLMVTLMTAPAACSALTRPDGGAIGFGYDLNGNLTSLLAPASQQTFGSSTYFDADHLLGYSSINQLTNYHVDDADIAGDQNYAPLGFDYFLDRQAKQTNRVGDSVSYARDASGRLYQVS